MKENEKLFIQGMHCRACELRVEQALLSLPGVEKARASIVDNSVAVTYDGERVAREELLTVLSKAGYPVASAEELPKESTKRARIARLLAAIGIGAALYLLFVNVGGVSFLPTVGKNMTYGLLFVTGLLTSFHCVAMCGGINLTQNVRRPENARPALLPGVLYNLGRVLSYTLIGGVVGAIGSVLTPSGVFRGVVAVLAGVFMVLMGLNLLEVFPGLNRVLGRLPRLLRFRGKAGGRSLLCGAPERADALRAAAGDAALRPRYGQLRDGRAFHADVRAGYRAADVAVKHCECVALGQVYAVHAARRRSIGDGAGGW